MPRYGIRRSFLAAIAVVSLNWRPVEGQPEAEVSDELHVPCVPAPPIVFKSSDLRLHGITLAREGVVLSEQYSETPLTALGPFTTSYYDLVPGDYTLTIVNAGGAASTTAFCIAPLSPAAALVPRDPAAGPPGLLGSDVAVTAATSVGLKRCQLFERRSREEFWLSRVELATGPAASPLCLFRGVSEGNYAVEVVDRRDNRASVSFAVRARGKTMELVEGGPVIMPNTPNGAAVDVIVAPNVRLRFDRVRRPGVTTQEKKSVKAPPGMRSQPDYTAFELKTTAEYEGEISVEYSFRQILALHPSDVARSIRLLQIDPVTGKSRDITTELDPVRRRVHGVASGLTSFMIAYPTEALGRPFRLQSPSEVEGEWRDIRSTSAIGGEPEATLHSQSDQAGLEPIPTEREDVRRLAAQMRSMGYVLVSRPYGIRGKFSRWFPVTLTLRYDPRSLVGLAAAQAEVGIYESESDAVSSSISLKSSDLQVADGSPLNVLLPMHKGLFAVFAREAMPRRTRGPREFRPKVIQRPDPVNRAKSLCKGDLERFCSGVEPGAGRLVKCLDAHRDELSEDCRKSRP